MKKKIQAILVFVPQKVRQGRPVAWIKHYGSGIYKLRLDEEIRRDDQFWCGYHELTHFMLELFAYEGGSAKGRYINRKEEERIANDVADAAVKAINKHLGILDDTGK